MVWDNTHVSDEPARSGLSAKATLTIALAGIGATFIAAIASSWPAGNQDKTIAAQARATDKVELRGVIDKAETALLRAQAGVGGLESPVFDRPPV